ncbi:MAG TPA: hypothetical protein VHD81_04110 [Mycobacteriales bacterium]|nr:hypothetical protein [Mycobacteriales bacterium]
MTKHVTFSVKFDQVYCQSNGSQHRVQPYLWAVVFTIDGTGVRIINTGKEWVLQGNAQVWGSNGSHGNLGRMPFKAGDSITVPLDVYAPFLNRTAQYMQFPIDVPADAPDALKEAPGMLGLVVILNNELAVTDDGAEAGHQKLTQAVEQAVDAFINANGGYDIFAGPPSSQQIEDLKNGVTQQVADAVQDEQNIFQNIWTKLDGADYSVVTEVNIFKFDDLLTAGDTPFTYLDEGPNHEIWGVTGDISMTEDLSCGYSPVIGVVERIERSPLPLDSFRQLRDNAGEEHPQLARWYLALRSHRLDVLRVLAQSPEARAAVRELHAWGSKGLPDLGLGIDGDVIARADLILDLVDKTAPRGLSPIAVQFAELLRASEGETVRDLLDRLEAHPPYRSRVES